MSEPQSDEQLLRESSIKKPEDPPRQSRHGLNNLPKSNRKIKLKYKILITSLAGLVLVSVICGFLIGSSNYAQEPPDPVEAPKPSVSRSHVFQKAAVCTDAPQCSEIGKKILLSNGSAVDAAIAAMFCNSLLNQQSMGLGGGFFMTVYIKEEEKAYAVVARETAPAASTVDMVNGSYKKTFEGPLSTGVPGELRGMWAAYQRWGKLPWADLVAPALEICNEGFHLSKQVHSDVLTRGLLLKVDSFKDANLKKMYVDTKTGKYYEPGTLIKPIPALCKTLAIIAEKGGDELYNGSLSITFLEDLQRAGTIITADDLRNYQAKITDPIAVSIGNGDILYTSPLPSSGAILVNILNILSGYNFNASSINSTEDKILTYHRILEAFKYAFATRGKLGDSDFLDLKDLLANVTSPEYGTKIRDKINDTMTSNDTATYGADQYNPPDHGTAHLSIIAPNGDAVSVTSSINFYFGAGFSTLNTGIVMNNVINDFSFPGITNFFGQKPSPDNFISPGKRPLSSMNPSIIVDRNGNAKLMIGAAGGTKITTALALVTMRKLWFGQSIKEAIDEPRIHHQMSPMAVEYEFGLTEDIVKGLKAKGHEMNRYTHRGSVVCAIFKNSTGIYANADFRKSGEVAGLN